MKLLTLQNGRCCRSQQFQLTLAFLLFYLYQIACTCLLGISSLSLPTFLIDTLQCCNYGCAKYCKDILWCTYKRM